MKTELFLREKDDRSLLVVVDMINGFIHTGALADPKIDHITPAVVEEAHRLGCQLVVSHHPVIFSRSSGTLSASRSRS